jgi:hypothetical protein
LSSGHERRLLILVLGGIVGVVFKLRTQWAPNVRSQSLKVSTLKTGTEKMERAKVSARERE